LQACVHVEHRLTTKTAL